MRKGTAIAPLRTSLRRWHVRTGRSWAWLVEESGVSRPTVMRAAAGEPIGKVYAAALARVTGLRLTDFAITKPAGRADARRS